MNDPRVGRNIDRAGWSTLVLAAITLLLGGLQIVLPMLLLWMLEALRAGQPDTPASEIARLIRSSVPSGLVNVAFGAALLAIGWGVTRRRAWSHPALHAAAWVSVAVILTQIKPGIGMLGFLGSHSPAVQAVTAGVLVLFVAAQVAGVVVFVRFWIKPEVRAVFGRRGLRG